MDDRTTEEEPSAPRIEASSLQGARREDNSGTPKISAAEDVEGPTTPEGERLYRSLFEHMLNGFAYCRMLYDHDQPFDFVYLDVNKAFEDQTGLTNVVGKRVSEVIPGIRQSNPELFEIYGRVVRTGKPEVFETYVEPLRMWFSISVYCPQKEHFVAVFDVITERKAHLARAALSQKVLTALNGGDTGAEVIERIVHLIQEGTGFEAAAIRLQEGEDYPYYVTSGLPPALVAAERHLCTRDQEGEIIRDTAGDPVIACMCGNVIRGRFDPSRPYFTKRGSFWTNAASQLLASAASQGQRLLVRHRAGCESVALIALRAPEGVIGLIQLSDHRPGRLTLELVEFLEDLGESVSVAWARYRALEALRESEERFKYVFDHSPVGMSIKLPTGDVHVNEAFSHMLGYSREELQNHTWQRLTHPDDVELTQKMIDALLSGTEPSVRFVKRYVRKDGSILWADASTSLRRDQKGEPLYFMTGINDITEQKRVEEEAGALARFPQENPNPVLRVGADGTILYANRASEQLLAWWGCELGGAISQEWQNAIAASLETGKQRDREEVCDGTVYLFTIAPVVEAGFANLYGMDITSRKEAEQALQASEGRYRELVENANSAIIRWKSDGTITFFNEYAQAFFGYRHEEVLGRHVGILVPERESTGGDLTGLVQDIVDHPDHYKDNINENVRHDGSLVWMKWTNRAIYDDRGQVAEILAIGGDLTAAKQAEEEARQAHQALAEQVRQEKESVEQQLARAREELVRKTRLAAIGQVSAGIAHELRNPLGSVRNAVYLLKRHLSPDTPRAKEHIEIIEQEVARADRIIGSLLSLARSDRMQKEAIDLGRLVREVFDAWPNTATVRCEMRLDPEPFTVHANRPQLAQAVSNILANAMDAMRGKGIFRVEARHEAEYTVIVLSDTGPGLDPSIRATLFEPLTTTKATGTGLGLTISKQIIEAHGGTIEAIQPVGRGAEFHIRLPRPQETRGDSQEES